MLVWHGNEKEISGGEPLTTNNRMELTAAIMALSALKEPCRVTLTTDSRYLCDAVSNGWVYEWQKKGWRIKGENMRPNHELWQRLLELLGTHDVTFVWVKGHNGHPYNERCDELAVMMTSRYAGQTGGEKQ